MRVRGSHVSSLDLFAGGLAAAWFGGNDNRWRGHEDGMCPPRSVRRAAWSRRIRARHRGARRFDAMPGRFEILLHRHELVRRGRKGGRGQRVLPYLASVCCALGAAEGWGSRNTDLVYAWANEPDFFFLEATPDPPG